MSNSNNAGRRSEIRIRPADEADDFGRTREDIDFWINCIGAAVLVVDRYERTVRFGNQSAASFFGLTVDALANRPMADLLGDECAQFTDHIWSNAAIGTPGEPFILNAIVKSEPRSLLMRLTTVVVEGEALRLFTISDAPIGGAVALASWQENLISLLNWLPFGFEIGNLDDEIQFSNAQCVELFGYEQSDLPTPEDWWRLAYPDPSYRRFARETWDSAIAAARAENREMTPFDLEVTAKDGSKRTIQFRHRTIGNFNINLFLDVTSERAYAQELQRLADTDSLTGAMTRRRFFREAEKRYNVAQAIAPHAILMLDIDHFKQINDAFGHGTGDLVLEEFTRRCRSVIGKDDLFARLGGEEFAVLLRYDDAKTVVETAECLRRAMYATPFEVSGVALSVTVSLGVAMRLASEHAVDLTISRADRALYEAKNTGRNRVAIAATPRE
ncbi:diguanylate cyclase [Rhizobium sp. LjRoot30]|uniref:sensor domain-containing diguanylate cyclase n=1 Tax=Rhizobium sp. LjRoot30 TaxID=3342320 RepID=UPI003ED01607